MPGPGFSQKQTKETKVENWIRDGRRICVSSLPLFPSVPTSNPNRGNDQAFPSNVEGIASSMPGPEVMMSEFRSEDDWA